VVYIDLMRRTPLIGLPQALKIVVPPSVSIQILAFFVGGDYLSSFSRKIERELDTGY
jgi:hypothetical protein